MRLVATGSGSTCGAQLQSLAAAFNALTEEEKITSFIDFDGSIYRCIQLHGVFVYFAHSSDNVQVTSYANLMNASMTVFVGSTRSDYSGLALAVNMKLYTT